MSGCVGCGVCTPLPVLVVVDGGVGVVVVMGGGVLVGEVAAALPSKQYDWPLLKLPQLLVMLGF